MTDRSEPPSGEERRPEPTSSLAPGEIERWYWTQAELRQIARELGIPSGGTKGELAARVRAGLAGEPLPSAKRSPRKRLEGPLSSDTVIPDGVVLSRELRDWFVTELGPGFHADRHMRRFLKEGAGKTLGDAVEHWISTRDAADDEIGPQFELNRFTRLWWRANPGGNREQLRNAWLDYRSKPVEKRVLPGSE